MVLIEAVLKPFVLDRVREALKKLGITSLTEIAVKDFGATQSHHEVYRGAEYVVDAVPRVQISLVVAEEQESSVIDAILAACGTSSGNDGRILVQQLSKIIPIGNASTVRRAS